MKHLAIAIRKAAATQRWSQGSILVRKGATVIESKKHDEIVVFVRVPGRAIPYEVVLYPKDDDWECTCKSRSRACSHVAAAAIAVTQPEVAEEAATIPVDEVARVHYEFEEGPERVRLHRTFVSESGTRPLPDRLMTLVADPDADEFIAESSDLDVDRVLGHVRPTALGPTAARSVVTHLTDVPRVTLGGKPVSVSRDQMIPIAIFRDPKRGSGIELSIEAPKELIRPIGSNLALCKGNVIRPLGNVALLADDWTKLPFGKVFPRSQSGEIVTEIVPALRHEMTVRVETKRLPSLGADHQPRIEFTIENTDEGLSVLASLAYGDPVVARIHNDRLLTLGDDIPVRDRDAEKRMTLEVGHALNLKLGHKVVLRGNDAAKLITKIRDFSGTDTQTPSTTHALEPKIQIDGSRMEISFETTLGQLAVSTDDVMTAWKNGLGVVATKGGSFAPIPTGWLDQHGDLVAELLRAREENGEVNAFALPALSELCAELGYEGPMLPEKLQGLLDDDTPHSAFTLPEDLTAELRPYQRSGVEWLNFLEQRDLGGILADDMGLGKTVQALCIAPSPTLVICPTSLLHNWAREAATFRPSLSVNIYHGAKRKLNGADLTVTSYSLARRDFEKLSKVKWEAVFVDEAQAIKNSDSQVARSVHALPGRFRLAITGTPIENRLEELWSIMKFTCPGLFGTRSEFRHRFSDPIASEDEDALKLLHSRIRPFVLRRHKRDVAPELPPRTDINVLVDLSEDETNLYTGIAAGARKDIVEKFGAGANVMQVLEALLRLRQAACHPSLVPGGDSETSSKVESLMSMLSEAASDGHKSLVFSQWTSFLNLVEPHLKERDIDFVRLDGSTRDRGAVVDAFQADDGPPVMLISLKAGGTGLNLTAADHVFILDPWWNPAVEEQAADRAHRIGQDRPVFVHRLVTVGTVEERIMELKASKMGLAESALSGTGTAHKLTRDDLLGLLSS